MFCLNISVASAFLLIWILISDHILFAFPKLRAHQEYPVNYLFNNSKIKGLLIYHGIGTGKTYLSLGYTNHFKKKTVFVILPRFLKSTWNLQIKSYGIKNKKRFKVLSFSEAANYRPKIDFKGSIVVVDEVHKLVKLVRSENPELRRKYSDLFFNIQNADNILALTGTPIYSHSTDLAYTLNLVSAKTLIPYDEQLFRFNLTKIVQSRALFRGYLLESKVFEPALSFVLSGASFVFLPMPISFVAMTAAPIIIPLIRSKTTLKRDSLRELDLNKLTHIAKKYISFYEVGAKDLKDYPKTNIYLKKVNYSEAQVQFFMNFADQSLDTDDLGILLSEDQKLKKSNIAINSSLIQSQIARNKNNGRDIGNLDLNGTFSPKFNKVLEKIKESWGSIVVYSNYYKNGIVKFASFLDKKGYKNRYRVLSPELTVKQQTSIISAYNKKKFKILLLHPEITEGISLRGTDQLHILEPISNTSLQKQVIGRAVRYKSHAHLPREKRRVDVYIWISKINYGQWYNFYFKRDDRIRRDHYLRKYSEVNDNLWSGSIKDLDRNYDRKEKSPDQLTIENLHYLQTEIDNFRHLSKEYSIESLRK